MNEKGPDCIISIANEVNNNDSSWQGVPDWYLYQRLSLVTILVFLSALYPDISVREPLGLKADEESVW